MIKIKKSQTADTRTCDWSKVTLDALLQASKQHIEDVQKAIKFYQERLEIVSRFHDRTKISDIEMFHNDFKTGFKTTAWWEMHQKEERHHFNKPEYIKEDLNLFDILEQIADGCMAGMARSGEYRQEPINKDILEKAYFNTVKLLLAEIEVEKDQANDQA